MDRSTIENQLKTYLNDGVTPQTKAGFTVALIDWMDTQGVSEADKKIILNDLLSYSTFISLPN